MNYPKEIIDHAIANQWNGTIIDHVVNTRWKQQQWNVNGYAPLDTSHQQYARPVICSQYGIDGWQLTEKIQWVSK